MISSDCASASRPIIPFLPFAYSLFDRLSYVPDVQGFFESHAEKPAATMVCKSKLKRTKPMYR